MIPFLDNLDRFRGVFQEFLYRVHMKKFPESAVQPVQPVQIPTVEKWTAHGHFGQGAS